MCVSARKNWTLCFSFASTIKHAGQRLTGERNERFESDGLAKWKTKTLLPLFFLFDSEKKGELEEIPHTLSCTYLVVKP